MPPLSDPEGACELDGLLAQIPGNEMLQGENDSGVQFDEAFCPWDTGVVCIAIVR